MRRFTIYRPRRDISSEALVRLAAEAYTGKSCRDAAIDRTERGKPFFRDERLPFFSLSHSGGLLLCAMGDAPCGLDVQAHEFSTGKRAVSRLFRLAERYFHPAETERLKRSATPERDFFALWAARESYVKYTGEGITKSLSRLNLLSPEEIAPVRIADVFSTLDDPSTFDLPSKDDYSVFLCASGEFDCRFASLPVFPET